MSPYQKTVIKRIKKEHKLSDIEVTDFLISNYLVEDSKAIFSFRKRLKKKIRSGIDKPFLLELTNLYYYLDHVVRLYNKRY